MAEERRKFEEMSGFKEMTILNQEQQKIEGKAQKKFNFNLSSIVISVLSFINKTFRILSEVLEDSVIPFCIYITMVLILFDLAFYSADVYKTLLRVITLIVLFNYVRGGKFFGGGKRR